jgi:glycosyltransferase involved in cell wall biosynthesis
MIRVAQVIEALGGGGAERLLVDTARVIDTSRFELRVYTLFSARRHFAQALSDLRVPEHCLDLSSTFDLPRGVRRLRAQLGSHPVDIVHTHLFAANLVGRVAARLEGIPVVSTIHDADYEPVVRLGNPGLTPWKQALLQLGDRWTAKLSRAHMIAVSEYVAASVRRRLGVDGWRLEVIPNAVDTEIFRPLEAARRSAAREKLGLAAQAPVVTAVGRMTPQKGHDVLLRAFARVQSAIPAARLLLVGDGVRRPGCETLAQELGISARASFLGIRSDVPEILAATDVLVLPSLHEGFGLVLIEALAAGVPVIGTRTGPVPQIIRDGETGLLCEPGDVSSLAAALSSLIGDPVRLREMGRRGRDDAQARFALPGMVRRLESLYENVLGQASSRRGGGTKG